MEIPCIVMSTWLRRGFFVIFPSSVILTFYVLVSYLQIHN